MQPFAVNRGENVPSLIINRFIIDLTSIVAFDIHPLAGDDKKAEEAL